LRRAFESISIFQYALLDPSKARQWARGARISNATVRDFVSSKRHPEFAKSMKRTYDLQSNCAHPNRDRMVMRQLGEGSQFTLAGAGSPPLLMVAHYLQELLDMWAWFSSLVVQHFSPATGQARQAVLTCEEGLAAKALAEFKALGCRIQTVHGSESRAAESP
jgi:hypothetical protein